LSVRTVWPRVNQSIPGCETHTWVGWKYTKGTMLTLMKLAAGVVIAIGVLSPGMTPRADKCECKTSGRVADFVPKADTCECKAKAN